MRLLLPLLFFALAVPVEGRVPSEPADHVYESLQREIREQGDGTSGIYILEKGDEAFLARAWMVENARESIDILTFIWSLDRIGMISTEALLRAAERGVRVRVLVDDMILEKKDLGILLALSTHPLVEIRIYNPVETVGVSFFEMLWNIFTDFRGYNQRLHNKTFVIDRLLGMTGGRNVASEYFDYDQKYNFRDRDLLAGGAVAREMAENFENYWNFRLSRPIEELMAKERAELTEEEMRETFRHLDGYVHRVVENLPLVRDALVDLEERFEEILESMIWTEQAWFVSDLPKKNLGEPGLGGGGAMEAALTRAIASARERITLQSPYMVLPEESMGLLEKARSGVSVWVSTNSLASTDNIAAFSGYVADREELLDAGVHLREFRPNPAIEKELIRRYLGPARKSPIFVLHAKTLVIDGELLYVGTFNIDPRSANLNTEEGVFVRDRKLARQVEEQIEREMLPENSWNPRFENPNRHASLWRRFKLWVYLLIPMRPLL